MLMCREIISIEYKLRQIDLDGKDKLIKLSIFKIKRKQKSCYIFNNFKLGKEIISFLIIINLFQKIIANITRNIISHDFIYYIKS